MVPADTSAPRHARSYSSWMDEPAVHRFPLFYFFFFFSPPPPPSPLNFFPLVSALPAPEWPCGGPRFEPAEPGAADLVEDSVYDVVIADAHETASARWAFLFGPPWLTVAARLARNRLVVASHGRGGKPSSRLPQRRP
jgi:hypothetical protein